MIVPIVLGFYVLVCVSVVLFNCWTALNELLMRRSFTRRKKRYRRWFQSAGEKYLSLSPEQHRDMARRMASALFSSGRVIAFQAAMEELEAEEPQRFAACASLPAEIVRELFPSFADSSDMKRAYYSYLVARFHMMRLAPSERVTEFLLRQIREGKSLYNIENALRAVYSSDRIPLTLEALGVLDGEGELFLHEKLLVDGLLTFPHCDALIAALWKQFDAYSPQMQRLLLDFIRFASGAWGEEMLALLERTEELELKIACLRYFGKYPDERFRAPLYRHTAESAAAEWELCAACMTVLASYPGGETVALLKQGLRSRNWHVRYNAAMSLRTLQVDAAQVQDILTGDDRYAREMLQYRLGLTPEPEAEKEAVPV